MSAEVVEELRGAGSKGFEVWPVNMAIVDIWQAIASQWRPMIALADGRLFSTGLDYTAVKADFELSGRRVTPAEWARVKVMEAAATDALNGIAG